MTAPAVRYATASPQCPPKSKVEIAVGGQVLALSREQAEALIYDLRVLLTDNASVLWYGDSAVRTVDEKKIHLTRREADLLATVARHRGHACTYETIIGKLWPHADSAEYEANVNQIHVRMATMNAKFKEAGLGLHLRSVWGVGVELDGDLSIDWSIR